MSDLAANAGGAGTESNPYGAGLNTDFDALPVVSDLNVKVNVNRVNTRPIVHIVERWEFMRGCWAHWLRDACPEFEIVASPDFDNSVEDEFLNRLAAVIVGVDPSDKADRVLEGHLAWLRQRRPKTPVVAIARTDLSDSDKAWIDRLQLNGYIPRITTVDLAAAALRLVIAGGRYFPDPIRSGNPISETSTAANFLNHGALQLTKLTPRETAVLEALSRGHPNKIIAYELNISLSTVKAHVHSIIQKMKVKNRTEVVVVARELRSNVILAR